MAKRGKTVKKVTTITEISTKEKPKKISIPENITEGKSNKLLLENFVALQEALTNIGYQTKELNKKIGSLLELFEAAAKNFQEHPESRSLSAKIDDLIEQNKIIAKSLVLMHKTTKEKVHVDKEESKKPEKEESETEEVEVEKDAEESSDEEFKPEPLPEFNF
jgi:signal transduction histidine kinase